MICSYFLQWRKMYPVLALTITVFVLPFSLRTIGIFAVPGLPQESKLTVGAVVAVTEDGKFACCCRFLPGVGLGAGSAGAGGTCQCIIMGCKRDAPRVDIITQSFQLGKTQMCLYITHFRHQIRLPRCTMRYGNCRYNSNDN